MKALLPLLLLLGTSCFTTVLHADKKPPPALLKANFDDDIKSGLAKKLIKNRYIDLAKGKGKNDTNAIRVSYMGYNRGSQRVVVKYPLGVQVKQATLSFDVRFDEDFQWVRGGKLHGLGPKKPIWGGNKRQPEGWSARIMFRKKGSCETYLYDQAKKKDFGIGSKNKKVVFNKGKWHHVVLQVSLNDVGKANGYAKILIDNKEVTQTKKVTFRGIDGNNTLIQTFLFNTFHGGQSVKWSPLDKNGKPTTVYAYFDNFLVVEGVSSAAISN